MSRPSSPSAEASRALPENLRELRELRGLTQSELGRLAGIAPGSVSHFETGQRVPSVESLVKLADALSVSVDALLGRQAAVTGQSVDPIFLRASKARPETLETLRRLTAALLDERPSRSQKKRPDHNPHRRHREG